MTDYWQLIAFGKRRARNKNQNQPVDTDLRRLAEERLNAREPNPHSAIRNPKSAIPHIRPRSNIHFADVLIPY